MDHGIINVLLNRNICNSLGREILFCLLEEFVIFLTPVSVIGMCLHMMSFKSSFHVSQMCEVIYSCLEENCGDANLSNFRSQLFPLPCSQDLTLDTVLFYVNPVEFLAPLLDSFPHLCLLSNPLCFFFLIKYD